MIRGWLVLKKEGSGRLNSSKLPTCEVDDYELPLVLAIIKDGVEIVDVLHLDHRTALTCIHDRIECMQ